MRIIIFTDIFVSQNPFQGSLFRRLRLPKSLQGKIARGLRRG